MNPQPWADAFTKRLVDIALSGLLLMVSLPLYALIAQAIKLASPGPVLYRSTRVGRGGRPFVMYKFRSMRADSDTKGPSITGSQDPRVTAIGAILRAHKLDELPQLVNVLRGDMSLVGPRPELPKYVALYDERQRHVLSVRPGITGPTQIQYRDEEALLGGPDVEAAYLALLPKKLEIDLDYVQTRSLSGDLTLLLETVRAVLRGSRMKGRARRR